MTTAHDYPIAWNAGKPHGEPPDVGGTYAVWHPTYGEFVGVVLAVFGHKAEVEIKHGYARAYYAEDERGPGQRIVVRDCDYVLSRV